MYFLCNWRHQSSVGNLFKWPSHESISPLICRPFSILERPDAPYRIFNLNGWHLCSFFVSISTSIQLDDPCVPQPQRENDQYIMDIIFRSAQFKPVEIRKLNYCRLYMNVVTLADITKPNGLNLDPCLSKGNLSLLSSSTRWHTVNQDRPLEKEWRLWQSENAIWSNPQGHLLLPLGVWLCPPADLRY